MGYARDRVTAELLKTRSNASISEVNSFPPRFLIAETAEDAIEITDVWATWCEEIRVFESYGDNWTDERKAHYRLFIRTVERDLENEWQEIIKRLPVNGRPLRRIIYVEDILQGCKNERNKKGTLGKVDE